MLYKCEVTGIGEVEGTEKNAKGEEVPALRLGIEIALTHGGETKKDTFLFDVKKKADLEMIAWFGRASGIVAQNFTPKELLGRRFRARLRKGKLIPVGG